MNWGYKIMLSFACFIGLIFTLVYVSVKTNFHLVETNYYEQELAYESQIQRIKNHNSLIEKPQFKIDRTKFSFHITFPEELADKIQKGEVKFYRSSTSALDKNMNLELDNDRRFSVDISSFPVGAWKMKLTWRDNEKEYYKEYDFVI